MKHSFLFSSRGSSLIELMLAITISLIITGFIGLTYSSTAKRYVHNREMFRTQMRTRLGVDYISQELRNSGYIVNWDTDPDEPPLAINKAITGTVRDPNTESITLRYAVGPVTGPLSANVVTTLSAAANQNATDMTVDTLNIDGNAANGNEIAAGSLIAIYNPPTQVNVRRVTSTAPPDRITFNKGLSSTFPVGSIVAVVRETSFWIEGGNLMMRTSGNNQIAATNVEDLQVALINNDQSVVGDVSSANFAGMTTTQMLNSRAVRLSLTSNSDRVIVDKVASAPPSLEDHDRSAEPGDRILRRVQQTTVYLRNFGALDP